MTNEEFDEILERLVAQMSAQELFSYGAINNFLREELNDEILTIWEEENQDKIYEKDLELNIECYDNEDQTFDRYTVIFFDQPEAAGLWSCLGMSADPFSPQGFGQHSSAARGPHLGKRIRFVDLPDDCQRAVMLEFEDLSKMQFKEDRE